MASALDHYGYLAVGGLVVLEDFGGQPLVARYGRYVFLAESRLDRASRMFSRHGGKIVTVARLIEDLRQLNGIIAGISDMSWRRFLVFNAIGAVTWVIVWLTVGYATGSRIDSVYRTISHYEFCAGIALGVLVVVAVVRHFVPRK